MHQFPSHLWHTAHVHPAPAETTCKLMGNCLVIIAVASHFSPDPQIRWPNVIWTLNRRLFQKATWPQSAVFASSPREGEKERRREGPARPARRLPPARRAPAARTGEPACRWHARGLCQVLACGCADVRVNGCVKGLSTGSARSTLRRQRLELNIIPRQSPLSKVWRLREAQPRCFNPPAMSSSGKGRSWGERKLSACWMQFTSCHRRVTLTFAVTRRRVVNQHTGLQANGSPVNVWATRSGDVTDSRWPDC